MIDNRVQLQQMVAAWKDTAIAGLRGYRRALWPNIPDAEFEVVMRALGEISVDEAYDVLTRLENEKKEAPPG